jgi:NAD-dependent dihydropyrimidine dehydrogenase PreA subunit
VVPSAGGNVRSGVGWVTVRSPGAQQVEGTAILEAVSFLGGRDTVTYVIAEPCVDLLDKACIEECPVDCIYEGGRMLYIHPDECVDCGACEPVCPVEAIFYEDDVPDNWKDYYKANVEFFSELGSPGGASKVGKIERDHPFVAALPPQEHEGH